MQIMGVNLKDTGLETFTVRFLNRDLPLMMTSYESALESYFLLPFLLIFGVNIYAYRFCWLFYAVIALFLYYLFAKEVFDDKRATLFAFLLAINPTFIFAARLGTYSCIPLLMVVPAALLSLARWLKGKGSIYFACGLFLLGLGLSLRAAFIWLLGGIFFAALVFFASVKKRIDSEKMRFKYLFYPGIGMISFLLGYWTVVYYNLNSTFGSIRYSIRYFFKPKDSSLVLSYFYCFSRRIKEFILFIKGQWFVQELGSWHNRPQTTVNNPLYLWLLAISLLLFIYFIITRKYHRLRIKPRIFILVMFTATLYLTPFPCVYYALGGPRIFSVYPFLILFVAVGLLDFSEVIKKRFASLFVVGLVIVLSCFELNGWAKSQMFLKRTGGTGNFSDAIYELNDWMIARDHLRPHAIDWGFKHNLFFLSQGKIITKEIYIWKKQVVEDIDYYNTYLFDFRPDTIKKGAIYISHTENFENLEGSAKEFKCFIKENDLIPIELKRFYQRDGRPVYSVYALR